MTPGPVLATAIAASWAIATSAHAVGIPPSEPMSAADCVAYALGASAEIDEAEAKVKEWQAKLAEVESVYMPKLFGMAFVAPMYTVKGSALDGDVIRKWKSIKDWGPYTSLQATLALPLYTFGRAEAGKDAAAARTRVEAGRLRETENRVALEIHRYYQLHLFARSMGPTLKQAEEALAEAMESAQEMYDEGNGEVTQADLMKLTYGKSVLTKYKLTAEDGAALALLALKHTMGWPGDRELVLTDEKLSPMGEGEPELGQLLADAASLRPEWQQLDAGKEATVRLADAEILANAPVLFLAGQFAASWTPTRDDTPNPYHYDPYNDVFGGVAIGLQFNLDPWLTFAKQDGALALGEQVDALRRYAESGIPLQVKKAHQDAARLRTLVGTSDEGVKATRKWLAFSAAAFKTGTGEAKDVLEGLAAYVQAKADYYEQLQLYHVARAELDYAVGIIARRPAPAPSPTE